MQDLTVFVQHHLNLALLFALLVIFSFIVELIRLKRGGQRVTPMHLTSLINHQNAVVVDLRPADAFSKGHILGAISIPANEFKEKSKKIEKMKTRPIVLVCAKGHDSAKIAAALKNQGYHTHILGGGISSWTGADLPLVKE